MGIRAFEVILMERTGQLTSLFLCCFSFAHATSHSAELLGNLPLRFEENLHRSIRSGTKYIAQTADFRFSLTPRETWLDGENVHVRTRLSGSRKARLTADQVLPARTSYFLGSPTEWHTDVSGYQRVRYHSVYPGIDLIFHGENRRLEYDFVIAPNARPEQIRLDLNGQESLRVDEEGDLVIGTAGGDVRWKRPVIFQRDGSNIFTVSGGFRLFDDHAVGFVLGSYDHSKELVIDPTLAYLTYLGGSANEGGRGIALDGAGNVYIAGVTGSTNLPTVSALQPNFGGQTAAYTRGDAFIAKFSPSGSLLYLTYLGGSGDDAATAIAVDAAGNAYITGATSSSQNFPLAGNPVQSKYGGAGGLGGFRTGDAFVAKINPAGNQLIYSTFLGGNQDDVAMGIAIDANGNAYVSGATASTNFPTKNPVQSTIGGVGGEPYKYDTGGPAWDPGDAFIAVLDPTGSNLLFSTYFGGASDETATSIALDSANNIYVGGWTISQNFPTTSNAYHKTFGGIDVQNDFFNWGDGFIVKFSSSGALVYSTYIGGSGDDSVSSLAVDASGNVYFTGATSSLNFGATPGAFQQNYAGYYTLPFEISRLYGDAYAGKLDPLGQTMVYLTYLGGANNDGGMSIAIDGSGRAYVVGFTDSSNFPIAGNPFQGAIAGDGDPNPGIEYGDAFLAVVNPTGTGLVYSTFLGGNMDDGAGGVAIDLNGGAYIVGATISTNLPVTAGAFQKTFAGLQLDVGYTKGDAFYAKITGFPASAPIVTKVANAEGESPTIAANTWVEIKGSVLAQSSRTWQSSDFVNNMLPTALDGVSVTMNGAPAFVYYISSTQINVLTPATLSGNSVQVVVTTSAGAGAPFTVAAQSISPSFFVFNGGPYVAAVHLNGNGNLVGPATLYPGTTTPAAPSETISIYANGFGATNTPVVSGALTQTGALATMPVIMIGNLQATVTFAGLSGAPGEYQFNVVIPSAAPNGDLPITAKYNGVSTQAGTLITVHN